MTKQIIVIGLGQFGLSFVRSLSEKKVEILAIDSNMELVKAASELADEALCIDATDEMALSNIAPEKRDVCIVSIGDESRESSIICTALLRQMGAKHIISRANDPLHERILKLVGAHQVVNPERDFGDRLANKLVYDNMMGELSLGGDLILTEIIIPNRFIGKTLTELQLPKKYYITVVALRDPKRNEVNLPDPNYVLCENEILILASTRKNIKKFLEKIQNENK